MLLAGIAATLYGIKNGRKALSFFLLTRGAWLIVAELIIVTIGWTFNTTLAQLPVRNSQLMYKPGDLV